jgi:hypothetical protein
VTHPAKLVPAIVVAAHRRPVALARLLDSMARAAYPPDVEVPLVISIDPLPPGDPAAPAGAEVRRIAEAFAWPHGPTTVPVHPQPLGLIGHFVACGALSGQFGSIILLEDDLAVADAFYPSAGAMLNAYGDVERVALASLYGLWFDGFDLESFEPIDDGSDGFFLGVPYTTGLAFTSRQWARLGPALDQDRPFLADARLHPAFLGLGKDEWFPRLANAIAATDRKVVFPRRSLVTSWGDAGAHFPRATRGLQVALQRGAALDRWLPLDEADAVYDAFFELDARVLARLAPRFAGLDVELDLRATKPRAAIRAPHVLTTRRSRRALKTFGLEARPMEANVIDAVPGDAISLAAVDDVDWSEPAGRGARRRVRAFLGRDRQPSFRRLLGDRVAVAAERARGSRR